MKADRTDRNHLNVAFQNQIDFLLDLPFLCSLKADSICIVHRLHSHNRNDSPAVGETNYNVYVTRMAEEVTQNRPLDRQAVHGFTVLFEGNCVLPLWWTTQEASIN